MKKLFHIFGIHDWTKWTKPTVLPFTVYPRSGIFGPVSGEGISVTETHQIRTCLICGETQDKRIS